MSLPKALSREYRIYLALWRKAHRSGEAVEITASSYATGHSIRSGLYKAIRPYREGELIDAELLAASENFVVSCPKQGPTTSPHIVTIRPRASLRDLEAELDALGISEDDLNLPEEITLGAELEKLLEPKRPSSSTNPFYSRDI